MVPKVPNESGKERVHPIKMKQTKGQFKEGRGNVETMNNDVLTLQVENRLRRKDYWAEGGHGTAGPRGVGAVELQGRWEAKCLPVHLRQGRQGGERGRASGRGRRVSWTPPWKRGSDV